MRYEISSTAIYNEVMVDVFKLMSKGDDGLSTEEVKKLSAMVAAAEKYEDEVLGFRP